MMWVNHLVTSEGGLVQCEPLLLRGLARREGLLMVAQLAKFLMRPSLWLAQAVFPHHVLQFRALEALVHLETSMI